MKEFFQYLSQSLKIQRRESFLSAYFNKPALSLLFISQQYLLRFFLLLMFSFLFQPYILHTKSIGSREEQHSHMLNIFNVYDITGF